MSSNKDIPQHKRMAMGQPVGKAKGGPVPKAPPKAPPMKGNGGGSKC